ncbi:MAG TPA: hypothetical protein VL463_36430 [Kofleriaceae bacterium]|nr:hypothetical protein [Kofleriaceae bacterium]
MRSFALLVLIIAACDGPHLTIQAPTAETVIDHHGDVPIDVTITGDHVARVELLIDGLPTMFPPALEPPLPDKGDCSNGCTGTLHWLSDEATIGAHELSLAAYDTGGKTGGAAPLALVFQDHLAAAFARPTAEDQRGAALVTVETAAQYRGDVSWDLTIDGGAPMSSPSKDCRFGCGLEVAWDTSTTAAGAHPIGFHAADDAGETIDGAMSITLGDIPWASAIEVHGVTDNLGDNLEVELHLEDATTGADLGCTGQSQGMEQVDDDDIPYTIDARFVRRSDGALLDMNDLAGRTIRVHAIEDDDDPCPGNIGSFDDDMGTSASVAPGNLPSVTGPFGNVTSVTLNVGRPYQN